MAPISPGAAASDRAADLAADEPRGDPRPEIVETPTMRWNVAFPGEASPEAFWTSWARWP